MNFLIDTSTFCDISVLRLDKLQHWIFSPKISTRRDDVNGKRPWWFWIQVLLWAPAGFVAGSLWFNSKERPETSWNKSSWSSDQDLNSESPDFKFSALTTRSGCQQMVIWLATHYVWACSHLTSQSKRVDLIPDNSHPFVKTVTDNNTWFSLTTR